MEKTSFSAGGEGDLKVDILEAVITDGLLPGLVEAQLTCRECTRARSLTH